MTFGFETELPLQRQSRSRDFSFRPSRHVPFKTPIDCAARLNCTRVQIRKQQRRYYFFYTWKILKIRYLYYSYQKSESIKIAKKLLIRRVISRNIQRHNAFARMSQFVAADTATSCSTAILSATGRTRRGEAVGPVGILPPITSAVRVGFSAL